MGSVDKVLSELHVGGFSALAGEVPGLRPQKVSPSSWRPARERCKPVKGSRQHAEGLGFDGAMCALY